MTVLEQYKDKIEAALDTYFCPEALRYGELLESMRYSLLAGGKRIRPALTLEFCRCAGGDPESVLPVACAVEMIHTYSLIHDDLPCMDDDTLRRGKPTNHMVYGVCTATLAGDAMQAEAFSTLCSAALPAERKLACVEILAVAAGAYGMCAGQYLDTVAEGHNLTDAQLREIHSKKTGCMLSAACELGVAAAGGDAEMRSAAREYGMLLGLAFQIRDDVLDVVSSTDALGKPVFSDAQNQKTTFMTLYGQEKCQGLIEDFTRRAQDAVRDVFPDSDGLCALAGQLAYRMQ